MPRIDKPRRHEPHHIDSYAPYRPNARPSEIGTYVLVSDPVMHCLAIGERVDSVLFVGWCLCQTRSEMVES